MENFIDFAHPSYLHRDTIGSWTHDYAESGAVATVEVQAEPWGFTTLNYFTSRRQGFRVDWYRPNLSVLHFGGCGEGKLHVFSIPVSATHTRVMTVRRLPPGADAAAWSARAATDRQHDPRRGPGGGGVPGGAGGRLRPRFPSPRTRRPSPFAAGTGRCWPSPA